MAKLQNAFTKLSTGVVAAFSFIICAALGVVLSFMMAVTTLSLPSLVMLSKAVKPKLLAIFTAICVVGIIAAGYLFNVVQSVQGWM